MARFWEVREQYDSALQCWNRVQLLDRHLYLDSRLAAARCAQLLEDPSLAESYLSEALNLDSLYTEARLQRGLLQARQQNFMQALADFSYILMQEPAHPEARYNRAMLYFRAEKFDSAAADVTRLITDTPKDGRAHGLMAAIAAEQQDKGTCLVHLEQALLHGYPVQEIMDYVPAFRAYQQDPDFQALFKRVTGDSLDRGRLSP
jgi:tetratricopeptide (TPR) repeat protein